MFFKVDTMFNKEAKRKIKPKKYILQVNKLKI